MNLFQWSYSQFLFSWNIVLNLLKEDIEWMGFPNCVKSSHSPPSRKGKKEEEEEKNTLLAGKEMTLEFQISCMVLEFHFFQDKILSLRIPKMLSKILKMHHFLKGCP